MTKKDFVKFARIIAQYKIEGMNVIGVSRIESDLISIFFSENQKFNVGLWDKYIREETTKITNEPMEIVDKRS